jgi:hypothetical protein
MAQGATDEQLRRKYAPKHVRHTDLAGSIPIRSVALRLQTNRRSRAYSLRQIRTGMLQSLREPSRTNRRLGLHISEKLVKINNLATMADVATVQIQS